MSTLPRPQLSLELLERLRGRRRRLRAVNGSLRMASWLVVLVWLSFFLDWTLELPVAVRVLHVFAGFLLVIVGVRTFWLGPRRRLSLEQLAHRVEDSSASLDQSLITAVQLAGADNPRAQFYSPALLARSVQQAESAMTQVPVENLLSRRATFGAFVVFLVLLVPMLVLADARRDLASTYVQRNVFFSSIDWPREYLLELVEPAPDQRETLLAMGDSLTVLVAKTRGGNARVLIDVTYDEDERETFTLEQKGEDQFRKVFRNVTRDFRFVVRAGDFRSLEYRVAVRLRPRIESIELTYDYPQYTGLSADAGLAQNLGGHIKAPVGTIVNYRAVTSLPVAAAQRLERHLGAPEDEIAKTEDLEVTDGRWVAGSFPLERNGYYEFRLSSQDGFANSSPIRYRISVIPDNPPSVVIVKPGRNLEVSTRASFPILVEAMDDYGVERGELVVRMGLDGDASEEIRIPLPALQTEEVPDAEANERRGRVSSAEFQADLQELKAPGTETSQFSRKVEEGDRLEYLVEVVDAIGQVGASRTYQLTVVREEDLVRIIQDDLSAARERLEETLGVQRESRREMERLADDTRLAGGQVQQEELPNIRHARLSQEKINQRLEESEEKFQEIIDRIRENRLNDVKDLPWIEGLRDQVANMSQELSPEALDELDELTRKASAEEASAEDVAAAVDKMRTNEKAMREVLDELGKWGDLRDVVRQLQELLRTEQDLEIKVQEKVKSDLGN